MGNYLGPYITDHQHVRGLRIPAHGPCVALARGAFDLAIDKGGDGELGLGRVVGREWTSKSKQRLYSGFSDGLLVASGE